MAWISVHDSIDGAKLRELYKKLDCSKFEATGILIYLWQWGRNNADQDGLVLNAEFEDIERYLFGIGIGCTISPKEIVNALIETGWLDDRDGHIYLHDWDFWQKEWYKYKNRLEKDAERKRIQYHREQGQKTEEKKEEPEKPKEKKKEVSYSDKFIEFWEVYPRTDRKAEAYECFKARVKEGYPPETLVNSAREYASVCKKNHTEKKFTMQAKTFLGTHLNFLDYVKEEKKATEENPDTNPFVVFISEE